MRAHLGRPSPASNENEESASKEDAEQSASTDWKLENAPATLREMIDRLPEPDAGSFSHLLSAYIAVGAEGSERGLNYSLVFPKFKS